MRGRDRYILALLSCLTIAGCTRTPASEKAAEKPPEVFVTRPTYQDITDYEEFIGHTDAVFTVEVRARVTGYLDKVNFKDGDEIEKGALLFQIDDRPYKAEFDRMQATLEQGKARLTRLNADHNRAVTLINKGALGREEFDRINGDFEEGKATVGVYTAALDRAKLDLDFTQVTAPISGRLSRRMADPGNLVKADETPLTTIVSLDPMYVYFDIDERTILRVRRLIAEGKIKSRQEAVIPVLVGLSDESDYPHAGTINFTDNKIDSSTGTLRVRGVIDNPRPRLFSPGLFVRIRLPIGSSHRSLMIDEQAISSEQGDKYVYVVRSTLVKKMNPKTKKEEEKTQELAFRQPIKVGSAQLAKVGTGSKGLRVVNDGLAEGDRVIVSGIQRVKSGEPVDPIPVKKQTGEVDIKITPDVSPRQESLPRTTSVPRLTGPANQTAGSSK